MEEGVQESDIARFVREQTSVNGDKPLAELLYDAVARDNRYWQVRRCLETPQTISALASQLSWEQDAVADFVRVASCCEKDGNRLLEARLSYVPARDGQRFHHAESQ